MVLIFPAESARTEDPGLSTAREAAEVLPAESVRRNGNQHFLFVYTLDFVHKNSNVQAHQMKSKKALQLSFH